MAKLYDSRGQGVTTHIGRFFLEGGNVVRKGHGGQFFMTQSEDPLFLL